MKLKLSMNSPYGSYLFIKTVIFSIWSRRNIIFSCNLRILCTLWMSTLKKLNKLLSKIPDKFQLGLFW